MLQNIEAFPELEYNNHILKIKSKPSFTGGGWIYFDGTTCRHLQNLSLHVVPRIKNKHFLMRFHGYHEGSPFYASCVLERCEIIIAPQGVYFSMVLDPHIEKFYIYKKHKKGEWIHAKTIFKEVMIELQEISSLL